MKHFFYLFIAALALVACGDGNDPENKYVKYPEGAVHGLFSVSADKKIMFSQGNLHYHANKAGAHNDYFSFAEHQYDVIGKEGNEGIGNVPCTIDLFGWSTGNNPRQASENNADYPEPFQDWGNNPIKNGGDEAGIWRTLTKEEWQYLLCQRKDATSLIGMGSVEGVNGLFLLPDNWKGEPFTDTENGLGFYTSHYRNGNPENYEFHTYTADQWKAMEAAGAVFLPAAGWRSNGVYRVNSHGMYWSDAPYVTDQANFLGFDEKEINPLQSRARNCGHSVRLVRDLKPEDITTEPQEPDPEPWSDPSFQLEVKKFTTESADIVVTPASDTEYLWANVSQKYLENHHFTKLEDYVADLLNATTYEKMEAADRVLKGEQTISLTGLTENATYYFVVFRVDKEFKLSGDVYSVKYTPYNPSHTNGALIGKFTVDNQGTQVQFSQGNLQYVGTWQFAENQWDYLGYPQSDDHRDLFGWGTGNDPNKVSTEFTDYADYHEWGDNPITNGGNMAKQWRTLKKEEWVYLVRERTNAATLFGLGSVNGKNGIILLPDNWTTPAGVTFTASTTKGLAWNESENSYNNDNFDNFSHNTYTKEQWEDIIEPEGAVFLPAAGYRNATAIYYTSTSGHYWSDTSNETSTAYSFSFGQYPLSPQSSGRRESGYSVRLVRDVK